jgi:hypothetical protein
MPVRALPTADFPVPCAIPAVPIHYTFCRHGREAIIALRTKDPEFAEFEEEFAEFAEEFAEFAEEFAE